MAGTVKIPGVGTVPTKYAVTGGLVVVGIAGFAWWRHLQAPPPVDEGPVTTDFAGSDPEYAPTGAEAFATDYAYDGGAYPYPSFTTPSYGLTTTVQTATPVTNSEWTQRSIEHLELVGVESQTASLAVSRYLLKECLTATQADVVRQAVAGLGPPPQGAFSIVVCASGSGGTGTPTPGTGLPSGSSLPAPSGLKILRTFRTEVQITWAPVKDAKGYAVYRSEPSGATSTWQRQTTSVYNSYQFKGLQPGRRYSFRVEPIGADNRPGKSATISATTKK